jgi:hypothetical protein
MIKVYEEDDLSQFEAKLARERAMLTLIEGGRK